MSHARTRDLIPHHAEELLVSAAGVAGSLAVSSNPIVAGLVASGAVYDGLNAVNTGDNIVHGSIAVEKFLKKSLGGGKLDHEVVAAVKGLKHIALKGTRAIIDWLSNEIGDDEATVGDKSDNTTSLNHNVAAALTVLEEESSVLDNHLERRKDVSPHERKSDLRRKHAVEFDRIKHLNVLECAERLQAALDEFGDMYHHSCNKTLVQELLLTEVKTMSETAAKDAVEMPIREWAGALRRVTLEGAKTTKPEVSPDTEVWECEQAFSSAPIADWGVAVNAVRAPIRVVGAYNTVTAPPGQALPVSATLAKEVATTDGQRNDVDQILAMQYPSATGGIANTTAAGAAIAAGGAVNRPTDVIADAAAAVQRASQDRIADAWKNAQDGDPSRTVFKVNSRGEAEFSIQHKGEGAAVAVPLSGTSVSYTIASDVDENSVTRVTPKRMSVNLAISGYHVPYRVETSDRTVLGVTVYEIEAPSSGSQRGQATIKNIMRFLANERDGGGLRYVGDGPYVANNITQISNGDALTSGTTLRPLDRPYHFADSFNDRDDLGDAFRVTSAGDFDLIEDSSAVLAPAIDSTAPTKVNVAPYLAKAGVVEVGSQGVNAATMAYAHLRDTKSLAQPVGTYIKKEIGTAKAGKNVTTRSRNWSQPIATPPIDLRPGYTTTMLYVIDPETVSVDVETFRGPSSNELTAALSDSMDGEALKLRVPNTIKSMAGRLESLESVLVPSSADSLSLQISTASGAVGHMTGIMKDGKPHHFGYRTFTAGFEVRSDTKARSLAFADDEDPVGSVYGKTRTPAGRPVYSVGLDHQSAGGSKLVITDVGKFDNWSQLIPAVGLPGFADDTDDYRLLSEGNSWSTEMALHHLSPIYWDAIVEADTHNTLGLTSQVALFTDPHEAHPLYATRRDWWYAIIEVAESDTVEQIIARKLQ